MVTARKSFFGAVSGLPSSLTDLPARWRPESQPLQALATLEMRVRMPCIGGMGV